MTIKKTTKNIVGSSVMLGVGGAVLGGIAPSMPTGTSGPLISKTIGPGGRMMGVATTGAYGMEVLNMLKPKKRRK